MEKTISEKTKARRNKAKYRLGIVTSGIISGNPTFSLFIGMCSVLATTTKFSSAFGMGLAVILVMIMSNVLISLIRKLIPDEIRIPVYIVIIAVAVTIVEMLMDAFTPALANSLGVYLPLVVVNCIIFARAESYASKNTVLDSFLDAIGSGLGYFAAVCGVGIIREVLSTGYFTFTNPFTTQLVISWKIFNPAYAIAEIGDNPGAFLVLGLLVALINAIVISSSKRKAEKAKANAAKLAAAPKAEVAK